MSNPRMHYQINEDVSDNLINVLDAIDEIFGKLPNVGMDENYAAAIAFYCEPYLRTIQDEANEMIISVRSVYAFNTLCEIMSNIPSSDDLGMGVQLNTLNKILQSVMHDN